MNETQNPQTSKEEPAASPPTPPPIPPQNQAALDGAHEAEPQRAPQITVNVPQGTSTIEWLQLAANFGLAVIGVFAICIYGGQLRVMKEQTKIAQEQTALLHNQLVGTLGAILHFSKGASPEGVSIGLSNIHEASAKDVHINIELSQMAWPKLTQIGEPFHREYAPTSIEKERAFGQTIPIPWHFQFDQAGEGQWPGNRLTKFVGNFSYTNGIDDNRISDSFCFVWLPIITIVSKERSATYGDFHACEDIQATIERVLDEKERAFRETHPK